MDTITLLSFAKVNLTLAVLDRRDDGYHDIDSVAQVIDLADELTVERAPHGVIEVTTDVQWAPSGPGNTAHQACVAFFEETGIRGGARVAIAKRVPARAGLGGGSANAAAVAAALDRVYETGLEMGVLSEIAARAGSDAPLFLYGGTVRMTGRGERVRPLSDAPGLDMLVVKPEADVSTAWAYAKLDELPRRRSSRAGDAAERAVVTGDRASVIDSLANDFDAAVTGEFDDIGEAKRSLAESGAQSVMLCGSGAAVFGVFPSRGAAEVARDRVSRDLAQVFVTRGLSRLESGLVNESY